MDQMYVVNMKVSDLKLSPYCVLLKHIVENDYMIVAMGPQCFNIKGKDFDNSQLIGRSIFINPEKPNSRYEALMILGMSPLKSKICIEGENYIVLPDELVANCSGFK